MMEIRRILASEAVALAAERHDEFDLEAMTVAADAQKQRVDDPIAFAKGDIVFQRAVVRAAQNVGLELLLNSFARFPEEQPRLVAALYENPRLSVEFYPLIMDLVRARDPDNARTLVRTTLDQVDRVWREHNLSGRPQSEKTGSQKTSPSQTSPKKTISNKTGSRKIRRVEEENEAEIQTQHQSRERAMKLTEFELRNVEAAARAVFPRNAHPLLTTGAEDLDVRGYFQSVVGRSNLRIAAALRLTILFCAFGPFLAKRQFATLASLDTAGARGDDEARHHEPHLRSSSARVAPQSSSRDDHRRRSDRARGHVARARAVLAHTKSSATTPSAATDPSLPI